MSMYEIDPTRDERWERLLAAHPRASIFHTRGWLEALRQTYGYYPVAFTTSAPGLPLTNALVFCQISNWLKGRRLVSLPFSDHCAPLVGNQEELDCLLDYSYRKLKQEKLSYVETRYTRVEEGAGSALNHDHHYWFHTLDLNHPVDELFGRLHRDCIQRKIRRAAREKLSYEQGVSDELVAKFYQMLLITRRRLGLPAQPIAWFRNIIGNLSGQVQIRVASKDGHPIASILTLKFKDALVYKYGCSDRSHSSLGGTQLLLWNAILEAKSDGLLELDLGRTDYGDSGLARFKERWGATRSTLSYVRHPEGRSISLSEVVQANIGKYVWSHAPESLLAFAGRLLYRHIG
jgi:Acetyltransferase (GNAT) domain